MSRSADTDTPIKPARFAHFVLRVRDLDASIAWYQAVLGMEIVHRSDKLPIVFMTYDDEHHRMAMVQAQNLEAPPRGAPGLDHVAYTLNSIGDLAATYRRLKKQDILPVWRVNHGMTTSLYYEDPDGNRVEFQVENYATREELNRFMRSQAFAKDPVGVEFDPEELFEGIPSGAAS